MATTQADVEARIGRALTSDEAARVPGLLQEAAALVAGYLGDTYDQDLPVVVIVESRMVARVLLADGEMPANSTGVSQTAGPYSRNHTFTEGSTSGAPWLSAADKQMLAGLRIGMVSVSLGSERYL